MDKCKCNLCKAVTLKDIEGATFDNQEFLMFCKNYSSDISSILKLKRPTENFSKFVSIAQKIFKKKLLKKCLIRKILLNLFSLKLKMIYLQFFLFILLANYILIFSLLI
jgi:hypothetical protein